MCVGSCYHRNVLIRACAQAEVLYSLQPTDRLVTGNFVTTTVIWNHSSLIDTLSIEGLNFFFLHLYSFVSLLCLLAKHVFKRYAICVAIYIRAIGIRIRKFGYYEFS